MEMLIPKHKSSNVQSVGFEGEGRGKLRIQFLGKGGVIGDLGQYEDVPRALFNALMINVSPGSFVHQHLKEHFKYSKVEGESAPVIDMGCGCTGGPDD